MTFKKSMRNQQGTIIDCVYCKYIHPELKGSPDCPMCHGDTPYFKPMRMMDQETAQRDVLKHVFGDRMKKTIPDLKQEILVLITKIDVYKFDLKQALIEYIQYLETLDL
jgi:hypothetical protein